MDKAKLFKNGQSQAVRLPKPMRLEGKEVYVKRLGNAVILLPVKDPWKSLIDSLGMFSEDYLQHREEPTTQKREGLDD